MKRSHGGPTRTAGFTLVEMVVALTLAAIVVGFAAMLLRAPIDQFALQNQRVTLVNSANAAWPPMREDLRTALPNSARARRNGAMVVLEMLAARDGWVRYQTTAPSAAFKSSGRFRNITPPFSSTTHYLSVNNMGSGVPGADAYALSGSMSAAGATISIDDTLPILLADEEQVSVTPAPVFSANSPRHRAYLVSGPITYLCNETTGTLSRYEGYSIAANQSARDTAAKLQAAGPTSVRLLAQGITSCDFTVGPGSTTAAQIATVQITATGNNLNLTNDSIQLVEQAAVESLP